MAPIFKPPSAGIERFDDEGGVLPSHFVGLQLDGSENIGDESTLRYEIGLGAGGVLSEEDLESPAFFMPQRSSKPTASLRVSYSPTETGPLTLGAFLGRNQLPADDLDVREVTQNVFGAFGTLDLEPVRLIGTVMALRNEVAVPGMRDAVGRFANAYLQAEYQMTPVWTGFGRVERSAGVEGDPYLTFFPRYIKSQYVAGLRWDLVEKQALKLEYANAELGGDDYDSIAVEWSLVFP